VAQLEGALAWWINQYNADYPHSAIGYRTPQQFEVSLYTTTINPKDSANRRLIHGGHYSPGVSLVGGGGVIVVKEVAPDI
jgi:hypothetical protein